MIDAVREYKKVAGCSKNDSRLLLNGTERMRQLNFI
jgi:hypothetical protein